MSVEVRRAGLRDVKDLVKLAKIAAKEIKWWVAESEKIFRTLIKKDKDLVWIAEEDNKIVGFLTGYTTACESTTGEKWKMLWLDSIYILRGYRNRGIGKILVKKFLEACKKKKRFKNVFTFANKKSFLMLKRFGFRHKKYYMKKKLR